MISLSKKLLLFSTLIIASCTHTNNKTKKIKTHPKILTSKFEILTKPIDTSWGYDADDKNFLATTPGPLRAHNKNEYSIKSTQAVTTEPVVLVNIHGPDELHKGYAISGNFVAGKHRSLAWATSYDIAASSFKQQTDSHDTLALPLEWSNERYRPYITFMIIPANTKIEFKIGNAAPQESQDRMYMGSGMQLRLKYIPTGTVLITKPLLTDKQQLTLSKGLKSINIEQIFHKALTEHGQQLPSDISPKLAYAHHEQSNAADHSALLRKIKTIQEIKAAQQIQDRLNRYSPVQTDHDAYVAAL